MQKESSSTTTENTPQGGLWRRRLLLFILLLPALIGLGYTSLATVKRIGGGLTYPYQLDPEEGFLLEQAVRLSHGETIYPSLKDYPYTVGNYPPVYPAIYAAVVKATGPSLESGRLLAMLGLFAILGCLAGMVNENTGEWAAGSLALILFLSTWELAEWIAFARVDLPALAFGIAGFAILSGRWSRTRLGLGVAFFTLAFFTKQTQVLAPAAVFFALVFRREWKRAALFAGVLAGVCGIVFAVLCAMTGGEFFRHTVTYNANVMYWDQVRIWLRHLVRFHLCTLVGLLPAVWLIVHAMRGAKKQTGGEQPLLYPAVLAYLMLATLSLVATGKAGASGNYLLEFDIVLSLAIGIGAGEAARALAAREKRLQIAAGAAIVLLVTAHAASMTIGFGGRRARLQDYRSPYPPELINEFGRLDLQVLDAEGDVLSDYPIYLIRTEKPVLYQPFIMAQLAREGKWDQSGFVKDLERGKFELVIAHDDLRRKDQVLPGFTEEMRAAIDANFVLRGVIVDSCVFVHKNAVQSGPKLRLAAAP